MPVPAISLRNVTVHYGDILALDSATLEVAKGTICGLIGMNGSGKSTLFKTIMGIVKPDAGSVLVNGASSSQARRKSTIGYVPQNEAVDWHFPLSVRDVVMMGRYGTMGITRRAKSRDHAAVDEALERVELHDLANRQIGELSGGQRKRTFVARGIAQDAAVLLLDEPFAGVDRASEATISALLRALAKEGKSILISTHDLQALPALVDEAALLKQRVLLHGSPQEVLQPQNLAMAFGLGLDAFSAKTHDAGTAETQEPGEQPR
ncbi:metal ABC transporter ATP-binding protein [Humidisolicoccus flavus]|uniref:metal ABC transporter ATP-binding protein n=1 Tax=Humidisolicoccus flavus TaxID=3111414 RepID=UPI003254D037